MPCAAGYVCLGGSDVATPTDGVLGYPCPVGHYCPEANVIEQPCNKGSYAPATAMSQLFAHRVFILLNVKEENLDRIFINIIFVSGSESHLLSRSQAIM